MQAIRLINALLAFSLEVVMWTSVTWWGTTLGKTIWAKWGLGILFLAISTILWGIYAAPNSGTRLTIPARLIFKTILFATGAFSLYKLGKSAWAMIYIALFFCSLVMEFMTEEDK